MNMPAPRREQIVRSRLYERVAAILLKRIIKGEIPVGNKLPTERNLAVSFEVNRSTIREALKKLESLEVIEIRHGDGVYVKDYLESPSLDLISALVYLDDNLDVDILMTLLEFRLILVPEMAAIAARRRTEAHVEDLRKTIFDRADMSVMERDMEVHKIIARASGNILYLIQLNFYNRFFVDFGHLYFDVPENRDRSARFHHEIYEAIRRSDPGLAKRVMYDVLDYAERAIRSYIRKIREEGEKP